MAYKVLGQTAATSPAASVATNLIKDPSFAYLLSTPPARVGFTTNTLTSGSSANVSYWFNMNGNQNWGVAASTPGNIELTNTGNDSITTAPFGASSSAIGSRNTSSGNWRITYGFNNGGSLSNYNGALSASTAIQVTAGTTYYMYLSYFLNGGVQNSPEVEIIWYGSAGGAPISTTIVGGTYSEGNWVRFGGAVTAPSSAVYATFVTYANISGGYYQFMDGFYFGTSQTDGITFQEPVLPSVAVTTPPFDKKVNGFINETYLSTSAITYAGPQTVLYTVPSGKSAVVSTISVANLVAAANTYRIAVVPSGETLAKKHFIHMDVPIAGNTTQAVTIGMTLAAGDKIQIAADSDKIAFTAFGSEA